MTHPMENDALALRLAEESFRHSWDMSDERQIDGAWVAGLCCECGDFVPYGREVAHVAAALSRVLPPADEQQPPADDDAEFWRLREQHQAGDHSECPPAYCLHLRPSGFPFPPGSSDG